MQSFILAGGFATRLWPLTEKRAKPLLPLAGKPIITHLLEKIPLEIPVTVSTNAVFADAFEEWRAQQKRPNLTIMIEDVRADDHKLGALGATAEWIKSVKLDEDVLLLTGDNYCGFSFDAFLKAYVPGTPLLAAYDLHDLERAKSFGTVILEYDGKNVKAFEEKPAEPKSALVSTGCSVIPRETLPTLLLYAIRKPDNVGGIFEEFLHRHIPVQCFTFSEPWFDIGSFEAYLEATRAIVGEKVISDGTIDPQSTCEGSIVIGKGSVVKNSTLRNVVVFENTVIDDCVLEDCIIDNACTLKGIDLTGKMLRAGTTLVSTKK